MILRSRLEANIKYVVTTSYSAIKMGFLHKIDNVSGSNITSAPYLYKTRRPPPNFELWGD